ncbi:MAG: DUF1850 domain-containing protein [Actinomycetaceae bacterium]|nr:DUF1850 domain-containing protein [Actinomycetaceae bacterium]
MRLSKTLSIVGITVAITVAVILTALMRQPHPQLCVTNQRTGEDYYCVKAEDGLSATLSWIHSIEHEPWTETYVVGGSELYLEEITLRGYGAGVPADPGGVTSIEDGVIHVRQIHRPMPQVRWIHSHHTKHSLRVGQHLIRSEDIEHHAFVELSVKE